MAIRSTTDPDYKMLQAIDDYEGKSTIVNVTREEIRVAYFDSGDPLENIIEGFETALDEAQGAAEAGKPAYVIIRVTV